MYQFDKLLQNPSTFAELVITFFNSSLKHVKTAFYEEAVFTCFEGYFFVRMGNGR